MELHLSGRVALVTGGSKGIGRGIALTLAREGADLAISARGMEDLERSAREIRAQTGRGCLPIAADLATLNGCRRFIQEATDYYGRADILVHSANSLGESSSAFLEIPDEEWVHHVELKFLGAVRCCREVIPHMQKNRWGRIVLIAGMAARVLRPTRMDNGPVCAALGNFGKQLSSQVGTDGIRVNTIHPSATLTPRRAGDFERLARERGMPVAEVEREMLAEQPLGRFIRPNDIAELVAFLCSDLADAITGQSIAVDGGADRGVHY